MFYFTYLKKIFYFVKWDVFILPMWKIIIFCYERDVLFYLYEKINVFFY